MPESHGRRECTDSWNGYGSGYEWDNGETKIEQSTNSPLCALVGGNHRACSSRRSIFGIGFRFQPIRVG